MADVFEAIARHARERADTRAFAAPAGAITYAGYAALLRGAAERVRAMGIRPGEFVGMAATPDVDYTLALMGIMQAGAIACPMNLRWPMRAILDALRPLNARHVFLPPRADAPGLRVHTPGEIRVPVSCEGEGGAPPRESGGAACLCIFTSGSTGQAKAALHGIANLSYSAQTANANMALSTGDVWLLSLPLFHVAGIGVLFRCAMAGATAAFPSTAEPIEEGIVRCGATHVSLVAAQLHRLLRTERGIEALSRLKGILLGGSAIPASLIRRAFELGLPVYSSYGLTETASQITATRAGDSLERRLTSGRPYAPDTVRIASSGEIQVRGGSLFLGYHVEGNIERKLTADGWFATGDDGVLDAEGYLHVLGRRDRMFVSGGENIQPEAVERALCAIAGVSAALVVPVADPVFGQVPAAFVEMTPVLDQERLRTELATVLPHFQIPRRMFPWPPHLRRVEGKISERDRRTCIRLAEGAGGK